LHRPLSFPQEPHDRFDCRYESMFRTRGGALVAPPPAEGVPQAQYVYCRMLADGRGTSI
jgi:hypothetical protein